ncbi:MAG TPA: dTDP-4-dehydrorhamnose reductase [Actinobacteria bacterium]|nr:dTDP-4-dehydrorhamnose reductase [Actinomycetes bacterium]HEX21159.1 dTDP-4-dehydrorhamnose reductase [Actinomycetota bacterium]
MKIIVTGSKGQLGHDLAEALAGHDLILLDINELDITDFNAVLRKVDEVKPQALINSAAYTNVDGCEENPALAYKVNAVGTQNLAIACQKFDIAMLYVSTDFVFDGNHDVPYTEFDDPNPLSVYGRSKLAGERYVASLLNKYFIVRTAWLYGTHGHNFVKTMLKLAAQRDKLAVVNDQFGSPTFSRDLAQKIAEIIVTGEYGLYHAVNTGSCSWFDFSREILRQAGVDIPIKPISSHELERPAPRPAYSVLKNYSLELRGFSPMRPWKSGLTEYFKLKG